ncbi:MAG: tetratricopeptide repeat protein [Magnetococcales bacterium]|nr:tetratricopeptide repeat protein [Magnetococcales bacterium]
MEFMKPRNRTLFDTGWVVLAVGLGGIIVPPVVAYAMGHPGHPVLHPMLLSSLVVVVVGGTMAIVAIMLRHQSSDFSESEDFQSQDRVNAVFRWHSYLDPGEEKGLRAIKEIHTPAVRSLASKLYQNPTLKFKLSHVSRVQVNSYKKQLANCGISCFIEPTNKVQASAFKYLGSVLDLVPESRHRFLPPVVVCALLGILWPLFAGHWERPLPKVAQPEKSVSPGTTSPLRKTFAASLKRFGKSVDKNRLVGSIALLEFPFREMTEKRDLAVKALNKNNYKEAEDILIKVVAIVKSENRISLSKNERLLINASYLLGSLGEMALMQSQPSKAAQFFSQSVQLSPIAEQRTQMLQQQGNALSQAGDTVQAEKTLLESVQVAKQEIGLKYPPVVNALTTLGTFYASQGSHDKAEKTFQEALVIQEDLHGPGNVKTSETLDNLAKAVANQNRMDEAQALAEEALRIKEKALGQNNPALLTNLDNLTDILLKAGRLDRAEEINQRALDIEKQALVSAPVADKPVPPSAAVEEKREGQVVNERQPLAASGDVSNAPPDQGLAAVPAGDMTPVVKETVGSATTDVGGASLSGLATNYYNEGNYPKALELFQRALDQKMASVGENDPSVAVSMNNLASILASLGRYGEAAPLFEKALKIKKETLPENDLSIATTMKNLATIYSSQQRWREAEQLQIRTLEIVQGQLGMIHPEVATSLNNLARTYEEEGRYGPAEPLYTRSLAIYAQTSSDNQANALVVMQNYANLLRKMNRSFEAENIETQIRKFNNNKPYQ